MNKLDDFYYLLHRLQPTVGSRQRQLRLHVFELLLQFDLLPGLRRRLRALQRALDGLHGYRRPNEVESGRKRPEMR